MSTDVQGAVESNRSQAPLDRRPEQPRLLCTEVAVVIRAAGERTVDACRALVEAEVPAANVAVVQERPFERALRRSYEIGLDFGLPCTMTVDADVLLRPGAVGDLVNAAQAVEPSVFQIEGRVHDKLSDQCRQAGHRLYRTRLFERALQRIPPQGEQIRPEFHTLQAMESDGFPSVLLDLVVGLHDHEQYYRDVYRKAYLHGRKHTEWVGRVVPLWRQHGKHDADLRIALHGMWHGLSSFDPVRLDIRSLPTDIGHLLEREGLTEKGPLAAGAISPDQVETLLDGNPAVIEWERMAAEKQAPVAATPWQRFLRKREEIGWWRLAPYAIGCGLQRAGARIKQSATPGSGNGSPT